MCVTIRSFIKAAHQKSSPPCASNYLQPQTKPRFDLQQCQCCSSSYLTPFLVQTINSITHRANHIQVCWVVWYIQERATYDTSSGIWSWVLKRPDQIKIFLSIFEGLEPGILNAESGRGAVRQNTARHQFLNLI